MEYGSVADWFAGSASAAAVVTALWLARKAGRDVKVLQRNTQRQIAQHSLVKLIDVTNSIYGLHSYLESEISSKIIGGQQFCDLWRVVRPLIGFGNEDNIQFGGEEASLLLEAKESSLLMDLMLLGRRHSALILSMREYGSRRQAFQALFPPPVAFEGTLGTVELTQLQIIALKPLEVELETLIVQLRENCAKDWQFALDVAHRFGPAMRRLLQDEAFPLLDMPEPLA